MGIAHPLDISLALFDLDGTLRGCLAHQWQPCHNGFGEHGIIPGTLDVLALYDWAQVHFGLVTNQGGIALGYTTASNVEREIHRTMASIWPPVLIQDKERRAGGPIYRYSPYAPDASSHMRKPSPYMILNLVGAYGCRLDQTLYVGDSPEDEEAAWRAGVAWMWAWQFFGRAAQPPNVTKSYQVAQQESATFSSAVIDVETHEVIAEEGESDAL